MSKNMFYSCLLALFLIFGQNDLAFSQISPASGKQTGAKKPSVGTQNALPSPKSQPLQNIPSPPQKLLDTTNGSKTSPESSDSSTAAKTSSSDIRAIRNWGLSVHYTPLSDLALKFGAQASFNANKNVQTGLSFLAGGGDYKEKIGKTDRLNIDKFMIIGWQADFYFRYFIWNSFALKSGIGYRNLSVDFSSSSSSQKFVLDLKLQISSVVVPIFIGNHWTLDNGLTFGCDWIGAFVPLYGESKASTTLTGASSSIAEASNNQMQDLGKKLSKQVSYTLLVFGVGYQF